MKCQFIQKNTESKNRTLVESNNQLDRAGYVKDYLFALLKFDGLKCL